MQFPNTEIIAELQADNQLSYGLDLFANSLLAIEDRKNIIQLVQKYLELTPTSPLNESVLHHKQLRKAVYRLVFEEDLMIDTSVETQWAIVSRLGVLNQMACIRYLEHTKRSLPLKLGRLLLYNAEFPDSESSSSDLENFEATILLFFSVPRIAAQVISQEWLQDVSKLAKSAKGAASKYASKLLEIAEAVQPSSDSVKLCSLFPHLSLPQALYLLRELGGSVASVSQTVLDKPEQVTEMLQPSKSTRTSPLRKNKPRSKFVILDEAEKQSRVNTLREFNRQNFTYEFPDSDEEVDEDPSDDDLDMRNGNELSVADKKLQMQEEQLWAYYQSNPKLFEVSERKTKEREAMRKQFNWTNEQIEGWGRVVGSKGKLKEKINGSHHEVETYAPRIHAETPSLMNYDKDNSGNNKGEAKGNNNSNETFRNDKDRSKKHAKPHSDKSRDKLRSKARTNKASHSQRTRKADDDTN